MDVGRLGDIRSYLIARFWSAALWVYRARSLESIVVDFVVGSPLHRVPSDGCLRLRLIPMESLVPWGRRYLSILFVLGSLFISSAVLPTWRPLFALGSLRSWRPLFALRSWRSWRSWRSLRSWRPLSSAFPVLSSALGSLGSLFTLPCSPCSPWSPCSPCSPRSPWGP